MIQTQSSVQNVAWKKTKKTKKTSRWIRQDHGIVTIVGLSIGSIVNTVMIFHPFMTLLHGYVRDVAMDIVANVTPQNGRVQSVAVDIVVNVTPQNGRVQSVEMRAVTSVILVPVNI